MSKSNEERNSCYIKKSNLQMKNDIFKNISLKLNYIIDYEIMEVFKNILNIPKIDFINSVILKLRNFLINEYSKKTFDEEIFKYLLTYTQERLEKKYDKYLQILTSTWENFQLIKKKNNKINELDNYYLKNFVYHCAYISEYAIHNCEKNKGEFGKYIKVYDNNEKSNNMVKYVICENCRIAYSIEHFLNYCEKCEVNYYSNELNSEEKDLLQATLKNPHCEPVINEKILCQYCKHALYINIKTNQIKCLNCRFISYPKHMEWKCNICSTKFRSDIKVYNKSEVNYIKKVINYALLIKKPARPVKLPCCKNLDIKNITFYHKKDCKGTIYFAEFHKRLIIICEKCNAVNSFSKFIWTCPQCSLRFKIIKWEENELKLRKELFNAKEDNNKNTLKYNKSFGNLKKNKKKLDISPIDTLDKKDRSKKKKNLFDILRKRTNYMSENNQTEVNYALSEKVKHLRENKELSTECSDSKNINNINYELTYDNNLYNVIKVKRNYLLPFNTNTNKNEINLYINEKEKNEKKEEKSFGKKNLKKRYIFDKLIRRQFISDNNVVKSGFIKEGNKSQKNILEKYQDTGNKNKIFDSINNNDKDINNSIDFNQNIMASMNNSTGFKRIPIAFRLKRMNKGSNIYNSQRYLIKNNSEKNNDNEVHLEKNSIDMIKKQDNENEIHKKKYIKSFIKNKENNDNSQQESIIVEPKIDVKKQLIKYGNNYKKEENKFNIKYFDNEKPSKNYLRKENKINKIISFKDNKLFRKLSGNDNINKLNKKISQNTSIDNEKSESIIKSHKEIANHYVLNNSGKRKIYNDSYLKKSEKEITTYTENNSNSKYKNNKEDEDFSNDNINNNHSNINNYKRNNYKRMNEYQYSSILYKNNLRKNGKEEKILFGYNTFNNKSKNKYQELDNEEEIEEEEDNTPDDVVIVNNIDKMDCIPLNRNIFKNPLLYNNIQQRIKHLLFRGRLPLFNVDNYTIQKTLGEGTNGVIYQVINNISKKNYAMKKLIGNTIAQLDYFQKEFQICHQNPHPYILDIYGVCARCFDSTTYVLYVLMDLAEKDLDMEIADRFKIKKYYKESELISMMKKLVSALFYLQKERNVAHRDIKPENILIFKKGKILKLADFGEAKLNNENKKKKTIRGTEFYMSPILYEGNLKAKYDIQHNPFKSDVFSLGYCFILATALDPEVINEIRQCKEKDKIKQILKKYFPKIYSEKYIDLLLKMIATDENKRVDFIGLDKILQSY